MANIYVRLRRYSLVIWVVAICCTTVYVGLRQKRNNKSPSQGHFWVFTDTHVDVHYRHDGDPAVHCRNVSSTNGTQISRKFGHFDCDTPSELVTSAFSTAKRIDPDVDFVVWLGDSTSHRSPRGDTLIPVSENLSRELRQFFPQTLIIPTLGNHDIVLTGNRTTRFLDFYNQTKYYLLLNDAGARQTFLKGGYYSIRHRTSNGNNQRMLRFVVLNTAMFQAGFLDRFDPHEAIQQIDAILDALAWGLVLCRSLVCWFNETMSDAFKLNDHVLLIAHLTFGINENLLYKFYDVKLEQQLLAIIDRYSSIIIMCLTAHRHYDTFRVYSSGNVTMGILNHPAISPVGYLTQPAIRRYSYDRQSLILTDYEQYNLNIIEAERTQKDRWVLSYRFSSWYRQTKELTSVRLLHLVYLIRTDSFYLKRFLLSKHYVERTLPSTQQIIHTLCALTLFNFDQLIMCTRIFKSKTILDDNLISNHSLDVNAHLNEQLREYRVLYKRVASGLFMFILVVLLICYQIYCKCFSNLHRDND